MMDFLFNNSAGWFTAPAIVGTVFFALRIVLMLVGGDSGDFDADVDVDLDVDAGADVGGDVGAEVADGGDHPDSSDAFRVLSFQTIAAFVMGFGWCGFATLRSTEWGWLPAMLVGLAGGLAMVWLLGILLKAVNQLQGSGNISIRTALGREGSVYVAVPARGEGRGQVRVVVKDTQRIFNAISNGAALPRHAPVRVVKVNADNTLTVAAT